MDNPEDYAYLNQLYAMTDGDTNTQASMYDIGAALGVEKSEAASLAESLFIQELAELKTLSGGIGITAKGVKALGKASPSSSQPQALSLGRDPVLSAETKKRVTGVLTDIKTVLEKEKSSYPWIEEMVLDIKTMEIQLLSPNPKTGIIREIFKSMHGNLKQSDANTLNQTLTAIISA
jgi:hypothetical protein